MSEATPNLVLEHLRAIRTELHEIREEQREQRGRLGSIERSISHFIYDPRNGGDGTAPRSHARPPRPDRAAAWPRRGL